MEWREALYDEAFGARLWGFRETVNRKRKLST
jgi:hypothetical protein